MDRTKFLTALDQALRSNPGALVEEIGDLLSEREQLLRDLKMRLRSQTPKGAEMEDRPKKRQFEKPGRPVTRTTPPQLRWGRIVGAGLVAGAVLDPYGGINLQPIISPLFPQGYFGRDIGAICYVSPCTPTAGPFYVKARNTCAAPATPQCPFGSLVLAPDTYADTYLADVARQESDIFALPFAHILYFKTSATPGYFVHEIQEMNLVSDTGNRLSPLLLPASKLAIGFVQVNPNLLRNQKPDVEVKTETRDKRDHARSRESRGGRMGSKRVLITDRRITRPRGPPRQRAPIRAPLQPHKETKLQFSGLAVYRTIMGAIDWYTESQDFVRAIYNALPCALIAGNWKTGPKGGRFFKPSANKAHHFDTRKQLEVLNKNWRDVDWQRALLNLLENHVEDAVIGQQSRALGDALKARGSWNNYAKFKGIQRDLRAASSRLKSLKRRCV